MAHFKNVKLYSAFPINQNSLTTAKMIYTNKLFST